MSDEKQSAREDAIDALLERWEDLRARGGAPDIAELCGDHPELRE